MVVADHCVGRHCDPHGTRSDLVYGVLSITRIQNEGSLLKWAGSLSVSFFRQPELLDGTDAAATEAVAGELAEVDLHVGEIELQTPGVEGIARVEG